MVQLWVRNLGNVKKARLKVSGLTIFVGKNNTNKTWTAYLVHSIASDEMIKRYVIDFIWNRSSNLKLRGKFVGDYLLRINKHVNRLAKQKETTSFFAKEDVPFIKKLTRDYLNFVEKEFSDFISVSKKQVEDLKISLRWENGKEEQTLRLFNETFNQHIRSGWYEECSKVSFFYECELILFLKTIMQTLLGNPFNLPVERNSLITFSNLISLGEGNVFGLIETMVSLKKVLTQVNKEIECKETSREKTFLQKSVSGMLEKLNNFSKLLHPERFNYNYPIPVKEFKNFVQRLVSLKVKGEQLNRDLLSLLQEIIEGRIEFSPTGIVYVNDKGAVLPVMVSSSMIKSLGGLYAYVAFKAERNDLLVIDEPENNLHPEAQVKITEFLSVMVNKGIKTLVTTHSPYVVDHVVNLIEAGSVIKSKKRKPQDLTSLFYLKTKEAFIDKNKVSVYLFSDDGEVKNLLDSKTGLIDWETFSSVSERISQLYYEI